MNVVQRTARAAWTKVLLALWLAVAISACTIRLAPDYDQSLVDGLSKINEDAQQFFAALAGGSDRNAGFARHEPTYNQLIGRIEALRLQAEARPEPPPPALLGFLAPPLSEDMPRLKTPTAEILGNMAQALRDMRAAHQQNGLAAGEVGVEKKGFDQKMAQALTVEKALKR